MFWQVGVTTIKENVLHSFLLYSSISLLGGWFKFLLLVIFVFCLPFDVNIIAIGNSPVKKKKKTQENKRKNVKKILIRSCRCVTLLLPQQEFTTELMTKGRAPCSPIVAWRTIWRLWMVNPSGPLTGWAFKQPGDSFLHWAGSLSDRDGKTRATYRAFGHSRYWEPL